MAQQTSVDTLKSWFNSLGRADQEKVLGFLYGPTLRTISLKEGIFMGPSPAVLGNSWEKKGLFLGPVPAQDVAVCPTCRRPY
jgi:hypothetical protein